MNHERAVEYYNSGLQLAKERKWDEAIDLLKQAIVEDPVHVNSYNVLGKAYIQKDQTDAARKCWRKALRIDPDNATARQCLAALGKKSDRTRIGKLLWLAVVVILLAALIATNSILLRRIDDLETRLAAAKATQSKRVESTKPAEASINQENRQSVPARVTEEAPAQQRMAILSKLETDQQVTEAYNQALADCRSEHYDQAIVMFQRILKYLRDHELKDNAQYWLAECYYAQKKYDRALIEFQKVKTYFPKANKVFDAELKVAYTYYKLGRIEEAKQQLLQLSKDWPGREYQVRMVPLSAEIR